MRLGVDVEAQLVAFLAAGGARLVFGAVGHHDRNGMIIRVNFGFHGLSFGAPAPACQWQWTDLGRSITQGGRQNKVRAAFASAACGAYLKLTKRVTSHECSRTAGRPAR